MKNFIVLIKKIYSTFYTFLNDFLARTPILLGFLVALFDLTSKITSVLLFDIRLFFPLCCAFYFTPLYYRDETYHLFAFLAQNGISRESFSTAFFQECNLPFQVLIGVFLIINEMIFFNLFCARFDCVKEKMISKHCNPEIMRERGYANFYSSFSQFLLTQFAFNLGVHCGMEILKQEMALLGALELEKIKVHSAEVDAIIYQNHIELLKARQENRVPEYLDYPEYAPKSPKN